MATEELPYVEMTAALVRVFPRAVGVSSKCGAKLSEIGDTLEVVPGPVHGAYLG